MSVTRNWVDAILLFDFAGQDIFARIATQVQIQYQDILLMNSTMQNAVISKVVVVGPYLINGDPILLQHSFFMGEYAYPYKCTTMH